MKLFSDATIEPLVGAISEQTVRNFLAELTEPTGEGVRPESADSASAGRDDPSITPGYDTPFPSIDEEGRFDADQPEL